MSGAAFDPRAVEAYDPGLYRSDVVAESVGGFDEVTDVEVEFFRDMGYLVVREGFSQSEMAEAVAGLLDLIDGKSADFAGVQFEAWARDRLAGMPAEQKQDAVRKLARYVDYDERLRALAHHPMLLATVGRLIDAEPKLFIDQALLKPPGGGTEKPWHQDKAFFDVDVDAPVVGVWIAIDRATPQNGCMHVIPGSHREGPVPHFRRRDWQICDADVQTERDVVVPLEPGGILFFDGLIHHGTPSNDTPSRRRALQFHYTTPDARWHDEAVRLDVFGSEGKDVTC